MLLPLRPLPDLPNAVGLLQMVFAFAAMGLVGRLAVRGRGTLAEQTIYGWGILCLLLTLVGVFTGISLWVPTAVFAVAALGGLTVRGERPWRAELGDFGRIVVLALPLLVLLADLAPSQIDVFNVMLPNSAYLFDHGHFPAADSAPSWSDVPMAPYNKEFVTLLGALAGGIFASNASAQFTIVLHLVAGLIFAHALAGGKRPGWQVVAAGYGLATLLDPGLLPRVSFAGYGEAPLAITLLLAGWLCVPLLEDLAAGMRWPAAVLPLALTLAAMVNVKQQGIGLVLSVLGAVFVLAARDRRIGWRTALRVSAAVALPAAFLYLIWRGYVVTRYPEGELQVQYLPGRWHLVGKVVADMARALWAKPNYLAVLIGVVVLALRPPAVLAPSTRRLARLTAVTAGLYILFLFAVYLARGVEEHSFFRYNTHLSKLILLAVALAARDGWERVAAPWRQGLGRGFLGIMLAAPLVCAPLLRFDRDMPQPWLHALSRQLAERLRNDDRVTLMLPRDNVTAAIAFQSLLRFDRPRRPGLDIRTTATAGASDFATAADQHRLVFLSCTNDAELGLPPDSAALLSFTGQIWQPVQVWTYPRPPKRHWWNWTGYVASEPFCLMR